MSETGEAPPAPNMSSETKPQGFLSRIKESFRKDKRSEEEWQMDRIAKEEHIDRDQAEFRYARYKQDPNNKMQSRAEYEQKEKTIKMASLVGEKYGLTKKQVDTIVQQNLVPEDAEMYGSLVKSTRDRIDKSVGDIISGKTTHGEEYAEYKSFVNNYMQETPEEKLARQSREAQARQEAEQRKTDTSNLLPFDELAPQPTPLEKSVSPFVTELEESPKSAVEPFWLQDQDQEPISTKPEILLGEKTDKKGNVWKLEIEIEDDLPEDKREILGVPSGELKTIQRTYSIYRDDSGKRERHDFFQLTDGEWFVRRPGKRELEEVSVDAINNWGKIENNLRNKAKTEPYSDDTKPHKPVNLESEPPVQPEDTVPVTPVELNNAA